MATLNVAEHFALDNIIGGIAPGKYADIVIIPDLGTIKAEYVISDGQVIAHDGELLLKPRSHSFSMKSFPSIQINRRLGPDDFAIRTEDRSSSVRVRVIDLITDLVTRETQLDVPLSNGEIKADIDKDVLKIAAITGGDQGMKMFVGLVKGFGFKKGAFATSAVWDACSILVVGANEKEMAEAVNRVVAMQGGIAVYDEGRVQAELSLPIGGVVSDQPMGTIVQELDNIQQKVTDLGCSFSNAHLTLATFTSSAIPFFRISEEGLVDVKEGKMISLIVD
jgi:adenine deaminase